MKTTLIVFISIIATGLLTAQRDGDEISLGEYRVIHSDVLNEDRTLLVALPDGYESSANSYPVLYLLYGDQVKGYFAEAVNIVNRLSGAGEIPELIIVGIANTDRYRDCLPLQPDGNPGGADRFLKYFNEELNPFVRASYRTKKFNILAGPQAGAAFGLYALLENSELFNAYIVSNPFWKEYTRQYFLERAEEFVGSDPGLKNFIFITYWDKEGWQDQRDAVDALIKFSKLFEAKKPPGLSLFLNYLPNNQDFIPPIGLKEGLRQYFHNYYPANYSDMNTLSDIQNYYTALAYEYGYSVDVPEMLLVRKSDELQGIGNLPEVKNILEYILNADSVSLNALSRMANVHRILGEYDEAISYYEKLVQRRRESFFEKQLQSLVKFKNESAVYILEPVLNSSGSEEMLNMYHEMKNDPQNKRIFEEREFNSWGYRLLQRGESGKAIEVLKLNVGQYPKSANAHDSLGEAYLKIGDARSATACYEKALELDPANMNAKKVLEELKNK